MFKKPRSERRAYRKMRRRHQKTLMKLAKSDGDFDWGYLHNLVITKIKHMYEYYSNKNMVFQGDESLARVLSSLEQVLSIQYEIEHLYDEKTPGDTECADGCITITYAEDVLKQAIGLQEQEDLLYKQLYACIGENIQWWWD